MVPQFKRKDVSSSSSRLVLHLHRAFYLLLLISLCILVAYGPVKKLADDESVIKSEWAKPVELPAPTATICSFGTKRKRLKIEEHFYLTEESYNPLEDQNLSSSQSLADFEEWYVAGHLNRDIKIFYSEPVWNIKASEWQQTRGDPVVGKCYSVDLSRNVGPGEPYVLLLHLGNSSDKNVTVTEQQTLHQQQEQIFMQLREKEDEFSVGSPMGFDHLSEGIFVQSGMVQTLVVRPKILQYRKECGAGEKTLTKCIDQHIDLKFPNCTRKMLDNEECTPVQKSLRNDQVANLRLKNLELLTEMTSCLKDCTSKRHDLKVQSQVSTHIMQETSDPGASKIHLFYSYQKRIRVHREVKAYGFTEFQAEVGGLSGLLLGLSIYEAVSKIKGKLLSSCMQYF